MDGAVDQELLCPICLEVLYKPVCNTTCGHSFCFWCTNHSMNVFASSQCPYCRTSYSTLPLVSPKLYKVIAKLHPSQVREREVEVLADEQKRGVFSPKVDFPLPDPASLPGESLLTREDLLCDDCNQFLYQPFALSCGHVVCRSCFFKKGGTNHRILTGNESTPSSSSSSTSEVLQAEGNSSSGVLEARDSSNSNLEEGTASNKVTTGSSSEHGTSSASGTRREEGEKEKEKGKQMEEDEETEFICTVCSIPIGTRTVTTCRMLDHILSLPRFSKDLQQQKEQLEALYGPEITSSSSSSFSAASSSSSTSTSSTKSKETVKAVEEAVAASKRLWNGGSAASQSNFVHYGVGCDRCGMFPIVGVRYSCLDCPEKIGYDLCKRCYERAEKEKKSGASSSSSSSSSGTEGRFSQAHKPEHRMEEKTQKTWLHQMQELHPELDINQLMAFIQHHFASSS